MKKTFLWMAAAIMTCGLAFTACSVEDNPNPNPIGPSFADFEDDNASFTITGDRISAEVVVDETEENGTKVVKFSRSNSSGFAYATFPLSDLENAVEAKVSFDFMIPADISGQSAISLGDAYVHNATNGGFDTSKGQYGYGVNGCIFYMGAFRGKAYGGGNENYFQINGAPAAASKEEHLAADVWGKWFHFDAKVNVANKTLTYAVSNAAGEVWWSGEDVPFVSENAATFTQLSVFIGNTGNYLIDNVSVDKISSDANIKYADYTISFIDTDGNPLPEDLKAPVTRRAKVGTAITLLDADKKDEQTADGSLKYFYVSDNSEGAVVTEEGTEIVVVFRKEEVAKYKYVINCYVDAEGFTAAERNVFQVRGEEFDGIKTYAYPSIGYKFEKDGFYYFTTPTGYNCIEVVVNGDEEKVQGYIVKTINYTKDESVVYFGECEDMEQEGEFGVPYNQGKFNRISQAKAAQPKIGASITSPVIPAGTYDVSLYGRNDKNNTSRTDVLYIKASDGTLTKVAVEPNPATWGNAAMGWIVFSGVTIPEGASLVIKNETETESISYDCIKVAKPAAE